MARTGPSPGGRRVHVRRYLDLMTGVFMLRQLPPWFENLGKRQVKAPKVYVRDSGLLHALLGITDRHKPGASPQSGCFPGRLRGGGGFSRHSDRTKPITGPHITGAELDLLLLKAADGSA